MRLKLTPALLNEIIGYSLDGLIRHHMPICIYAEEMGKKAALLREHRDIYWDELGFYSVQLADQVDEIRWALLDQEQIWIEGEKTRNPKSAFWHDNKEMLFKLNLELSALLDFRFMITGNTDGAKVIEDIGISDDDAIDNGCRISDLMVKYENEIAGILLKHEEISLYQEFYIVITDMKESAEVDLSSPHEDRILRDKIYLHLRSLEQIVLKTADAALARMPEKRAGYRSDYERLLKMDAERQRKEREQMLQPEQVTASCC